MQTHDNRDGEFERAPIVEVFRQARQLRLRLSYKINAYESKGTATVSATTTQKSLVLVLGAGASAEVNLPVGSELKKRIARLLDIRYDRERVSGDAVVDGALRLLVRQPNGRQGDISPFLHCAWHIRDAMPQAPSIDNFIDVHRSNPQIEQVGKLAIVRSILEAEQKSHLALGEGRKHGRLSFESVEETWYGAFFQLLTENCQFSDLAARFAKVAIVSFNYDRCVEHYLFHALQNYYQVSPEDASDVLEDLCIYHTYGKVGRLPWMKGDLSIDFGAEPSSDQLVQLAKGIRTFTEGTDVQLSDITRIRDILVCAQRIAFLGFAFHPLNVRLLFPPPGKQGPTRGCTVFASGVGISEPDETVIKEELYSLGWLNPNTTHVARGMTCAKLFAEYRRSLSLS